MKTTQRTLNLIFITANFTPLEQRKNKMLWDQLKEMNKEGNNYIITKRINSAEEGLTKKLPPRTDNSNTFDINTDSNLTNTNLKIKTLILL